MLLLQVCREPQLELYFVEERSGKPAQGPDETAIVDGAALVDHDLTVFLVPCAPFGQRNAQDVLTAQSGRAWQHPSRGVTGCIEQVGLDDQHRPALARLRAEMMAEVRDIETAVLDRDAQSMPSLAR